MNWCLEHLQWNWSYVSGTEPYWWQVNIGSGDGLVPSGNMPLPEQMLTQFRVTIWCHSARIIQPLKKHHIPHFHRWAIKQITGPLWGESASDRTSNTENISLPWHHLVQENWIPKKVQIKVTPEKNGVWTKSIIILWSRVLSFFVLSIQLSFALVPGAIFFWTLIS